MVLGSEIGKVTLDCLRGLNNTIWGGKEGIDKASAIVKTGLSGADAIIGVSHTLEDLECGDIVCASVDAIASISSVLGMVLGNIEKTKKLTRITGSITVCCRSVRYYCKNYGTYWGCMASVTQKSAESIGQVIKLNIRK